MILLVVGFIVIILGVLAMRYPELVSTLKEEDNERWVLIGSPPPYAFSKTIGVYSWLQSRSYEASNSENVRILGAKARKKAQFTKYSFAVGVVLVVAGFGLSLAGV